MFKSKNMNKFGFQVDTISPDEWQPFSYFQAMKKYEYKFVKNEDNFMMYVFELGEWIPYRGIQLIEKNSKALA